MIAWDDVALFLALYRGRTTVRAAQALGCSQPTVARRMAAMEQALGLDLFHRTPTGLEPTAAADGLLARAEAAEAEMCRFLSEADHLAGRDDYRVRVTFLEHFERFLVPVLRDFRAARPEVKVELMATDRVFDLNKGEADIALRGGHFADNDERILMRPLPESGWTIYASRQGERPMTRADVADFPILLPTGTPALLPIYRWLVDMAKGEPLHCTGYGALQSSIASGAGISALPITMGDIDPELVRCFPPMREFGVPIHVAAPRAALRRAPVRELFEGIFRFFNDRPDILRGVD